MCICRHVGKVYSSTQFLMHVYYSAHLTFVGSKVKELISSGTTLMRIPMEGKVYFVYTLFQTVIISIKSYNFNGM